MSRKNKRSKEEIAREFDLPERQSKIATIMKHDGETYCLCRSSDSSRFMIGCDGCEEWYHGDCINVSEKEAKHIKHYYCQRCKQEDPTLQTVFRAIPAAVPGITAEDRKLKRQKERRERDGDRGAGTNASNSKPSRERCGQCPPCRLPNCGTCNSCQLRKSGSSSKKHRCERRVCVNPPAPMLQQADSAAGGGHSSASNAHSSSTNKPITAQTPLPAVASHKKDKSQSGSAAPSRQKKRRRSASPTAGGRHIPINPELEGPRQCHGPGCRFTARPQSKYCTDECGRRLATNRIFRVLPQRIQEWNLSVSQAELQNQRMLDAVRAKQAAVRATLGELDKRHRELDSLVERAKRCTLDATGTAGMDALDAAAADQDEQSMYCITCGHEIHSKTAIRHMEKCFNKYESQASFGSNFKTRIEGNRMFCDFYNAASQTYCKRLRVLCPEHSKDAKVGDADVCGCPLVRNTFELTGEFCRAPKKSCFRHYVWEKIRLAEIDLERVRQWLKVDELMEQERQIRMAMASRAGVLGLMLHSTYNHDVMEKLCQQQQQQQQQQLQQQQQQQQQQRNGTTNTH